MPSPLESQHLTSSLVWMQCLSFRVWYVDLVSVSPWFMLDGLLSNCSSGSVGGPSDVACIAVVWMGPIATGQCLGPVGVLAHCNHADKGGPLNELWDLWNQANPNHCPSWHPCLLPQMSAQHWHCFHKPKEGRWLTWWLTKCGCSGQMAQTIWWPLRAWL